MKDLGWKVYEMCGNGIAHYIDNIEEQIKSKRNIFCFKDNCDLVKLFSQNEKNMYRLEFDHKGQDTFDFIEFLFNNRSGGNFLYARNTDLKRELDKSILEFNGIPFLSPELVLLYKSTDINREGYQLDYDEAIVAMDDEQKSWLLNTLSLMYPAGHPINGLPDGERSNCIHTNIPRLVALVQQEKPKLIIVCKITLVKPQISISEIMKSYRDEESIFFLPFPGNGNQKKYREGLIKALQVLDFKKQD